MIDDRFAMIDDRFARTMDDVRQDGRDTTRLKREDGRWKHKKPLDDRRLLTFLAWMTMRFAHLDKDKLPPLRLKETPIEKWGFEKFRLLASNALFFAAAAPIGCLSMVPSGTAILGGMPASWFIPHSGPFNVGADPQHPYLL
jgi:hypothetical protein